MFRLRELLERHRAEIAKTVTEEHGKVLAEAAQEVTRGMEVVELAAAAPSLLKGERLPEVAHGLDVELVRVPLGVVAGFTPFNFPAMIPLWMVPLAVVAGNTFVLKPSERTPLTALRLAEVFTEAGLPPGVFNVVLGAAPVAEVLLAHPDVRAVSVVGSERTAETVYRAAAQYGKRVQALGGAKNFHVVMPDAPLEQTVAALIGSAYGSAGERCLACGAVLAVGDVQSALIDRLAAAAEQLQLGPGWEAGVDMGPLIREGHRARVEAFIEEGLKAGAHLVLDGRRHPARRGPGYFLGPSLFTDVTVDMTIVQEEIFGPVLSVLNVADLATAIEVANRSHFGNTATIYTCSGAAARVFSRDIEAGMVGVNVGVAAPVGYFPFAGWKRSFFGDLHTNGHDGLRFYTEVRVVTSRWPMSSVE